MATTAYCHPSQVTAQLDNVYIVLTSSSIIILTVNRCFGGFCAFPSCRRTTYVPRDPVLYLKKKKKKKMKKEKNDAANLSRNLKTEFNSNLSSGLVHPFQLDETISIFRGSSVLIHFVLFLIEIHGSKQ